MRNLLSLLEELKLKSFAGNLDEILEQYPSSRENIIHALESFCQAELIQRKERSVTCKIQQAKFAQIQTVDTFDFQYNASTKKIKNRYLKLFTTEVTRQGLCVLFVGGSGLGKTHLARALGYYLCQQCQKIRFITLPKLALDLKTADETGTLKKVMLNFTQPASLIIDEVGYTNLREQESNLVFQIISQRYDHKRSTMITTNRAFGEWNQIFHNDAMAHALLDRLTERSEVFHLEGKSYRETHRKKLKS